MQRQTGFSLLELIIVISLISLVSILAVPQLKQSLAKQELDDAARTLAADIRFLQQLSRNAGAGPGATAYQMKFSYPVSGQYRIYGNLTPVKSVSFPASIRFTGTIDPLTFDLTGAPNSGRTIAIASSAAAATRYIFVAAVTGRVRVSDKPEVGP